MTATATTWIESPAEIYGPDVESAPLFASWAYGRLLRDDSEYLEHLSDLVDSIIESSDVQTDVDTPQLERKLRALQWGGYLLARPFTFPKWSTEELGWHPSSPSEAFFEECLRGAMGAWEIRLAYQGRIADLIRYGKDEGISLNESSLMDFWAFVRSAGCTRRAGLALMDNGNLRAVWKGEDGEHLGLHFLGNHTVNYVIFKRRPGSTGVSRVAGNDTFDGIRRQIRAFHLTPLVSA